MSFKPLFARSLDAAPERLHFAAHSHHLWPDASFAGQVQAWDDAVRLADRKWDQVMGPLWEEAQTQVAAELGTRMPEALAFSSNTHDFILRIVSACPRQGTTLRMLTSDSEFHSARRQFSRWVEDGWLEVEQVPAEPFETFSARLLERAKAGAHDLVFASQVMFSNGRLFDRVDELAACGRPEGPWVVIDGYHSFMAIEQPLSAEAAPNAFFLGGGYKYAMAGEGVAFLHAPPGYGPRPSITGWFAEFEDLKLPPDKVGYAPDGSRFLGATFDPSGLYRFVSVRRMLDENGLDTTRVSAYARNLQEAFLNLAGEGPLKSAELLNPLDDAPHARFLAFRCAEAKELHDALMARDVITDVRGDVLRIGFALYQDEADVERLATITREL